MCNIIQVKRFSQTISTGVFYMLCKNKIFRIQIFPFLLILISCSPSYEEKMEIAIVACNIMAESRNMDAALRIKEMNEAREKVGEGKFLLRDESIKEAFSYGLCESLVLNEKDYMIRLNELKADRFEQQRIEQEKKNEESRKRAEKYRIEVAESRKKAEKQRVELAERAEKRRIELAERAEKRRIELAERAEKRRIELAEKEREKAELISEAQKKWRASLLEYLKPLSYVPTIINSTFDDDTETFKIIYNCKEIKKFKVNLKLNLKKDLGTLEAKNEIGYCSKNGTYLFSFNGRRYSRLKSSTKLSNEMLNALTEIDDPSDLIQDAQLEVIGLSSTASLKLKRELYVTSFPPLKSTDDLTKPIILNFKLDM